MHFLLNLITNVTSRSVVYLLMLWDVFVVLTPVLFGVVQTLEVVVFASESASPRIPRRAVFVQVFEDIEMAESGSICTR